MVTLIIITPDTDAWAITVGNTSIIDQIILHVVNLTDIDQEI